MKIKPVGPDARIDAAVVGFTARVRDFYEDAEADWSKAITSLGVRSTPKTKTSDGYEQRSFTLVTDLDREAGLLRLHLHAQRDGNDLVFGDRSAIQFNGMLLLRAVLDPDTCGPCAIDGKLNVVGTGHPGEMLTQRQLPLLGQAVEHVLDALITGFPSIEVGHIWLKSVEACCGMTVPNAVIAARVLHHATLHGAIGRQMDQYRRVSCKDDEGIPALSFFSHMKGPVSKIYPKTIVELRFEIACRDRRAVRQLQDEAMSAESDASRPCVDERIAEFSAAGAEGLFINFLNAAMPRLNRIEAHAEAALAGEHSIGQLLTSLISLIDRAAGHQKRKGPASPEAQIMATEAVEALLSVGMFDCRGAHSRTAIRKELDGLCSEEGPLSKHPHRAIYYLKPQFAHACGKLRGVADD